MYTVSFIPPMTHLWINLWFTLARNKYWKWFWCWGQKEGSKSDILCLALDQEKLQRQDNDTRPPSERGSSSWVRLCWKHVISWQQRSKCPRGKWHVKTKRQTHFSPWQTAGLHLYFHRHQQCWLLLLNAPMLRRSVRGPGFSAEFLPTSKTSWSD